MKNIALCFDHARDRSGSLGATNASALFALLRSDDDQIVWSRADDCRTGRTHFAARRRQSHAIDIARTSVVEVYEFLVDRWEPGDRLYLFGAGRGAYCARALTRLLGTVGVLRGSDLAGWTVADFTRYVLSTYAMPRTHRNASDWRRVGQLAAQLAGRGDIAVDVDFLGLWDTVAVPGPLGTPDVRAPETGSHAGAGRRILSLPQFTSSPRRSRTPTDRVGNTVRGGRVSLFGPRSQTRLGSARDDAVTFDPPDSARQEDQ